MNKLIAFTGKKGHGKSTAAEYMVNVYRYQKQSLGAQLKAGVEAMFGVSGIATNDPEAKKGNINIGTNRAKIAVPIRKIMQTLGTEWGRNMIDPNIWLYETMDKFETMRKIPGYTGMVIDDIRFDNEAEWVLSQGGMVISVEADIVDTFAECHESERGISSHLISHIIANTGTIEELHDKIEDIVAGGSFGDTEEPSIAGLQEQISSWADGVFPDRTVKNAIDKLVYEELPEFLMDQKDPMELADIAILVYDIAHLAGVDLEKAMRDKMKINRNRTWEINEKTGLMHHVSDGPEFEDGPDSHERGVRSGDSAQEEQSNDTCPGSSCVDPSCPHWGVVTVEKYL